MALTNKQQVFIEEYLQCWNATEAARRAGYSERTVRSIAAENLTKPDIKAEIEKRIAEKAMSADEVLTRLAEHARGDLGEFAGIDTSADLANHPLSRIAKKFKKNVWYDKNKERHESIELELYDGQSALVSLGKYHSLFTDKVEHTGKDGDPIEVKIVGGLDLDKV